MSLEIVRLQNKHLADAVALFAARYRGLCRQRPEAPEKYGQAETVLPLLVRLLERGQGYAALRGGQLAGYLAGWLTPRFRGQATVYSPEWANAAEEGDSARVYQRLYTVASEHWVADRYFDHYLTLLTNDTEGIEAWRRLGFGDFGADAIRDTGAINAVVPPGVEIRQAGPADAFDGLALWQGLMAHLAAAPIFLTDAAEAQPQEFADWFADQANALWIAYQDGRAIASIGVGPANDSACTIIRDEETASFVSAYTCPEARSSGVASALLSRAVAWARGQGYVRCAVDFETANSQAMAFWLRHFHPICRSLGRRVNPFILDVSSPRRAPVP